MSNLRKYIYISLSVLLVATIFYFVSASGGDKTWVADSCKSPNDEVDIYIAWNKHPIENYTGYGVALVAGRCPPYTFTSRINGTNGDLKQRVYDDIQNHIIVNNVTLDVIQYPKGQKIDGRANFTI